MLILTRKLGESVVIENDIIVNISDGIKISVEKIKSNQGQNIHA